MPQPPPTARPTLASRLLAALQRAGQEVFRYNARQLVRWALGAACRARFLGEERVPRRGGVIVACNHASFADPVVLQAYVPRHLTFLMTDEYYHVPVLHAFVRFYGCLCVEERGFNKEVLRAAERVLGQGRAVGVFPEGGISRDGLVHDARPGVALLALRARVPILPVGMAGVSDLLPPDTWTLHGARITICVGQPILPGGLGRDELAARVTREMRACARLARQQAPETETFGPGAL